MLREKPHAMIAGPGDDYQKISLGLDDAGRKNPKIRGLASAIHWR
jgi:hypothetical protein